MILYPKRMAQLIDFEGMQYGKCKATDIDGLIEYQNEAYIFFELKHNNADFPKGQRLALERLVIDTSHKHSIAIIADHFTEKDEVINAKHCMVREVFISTERRWREPKKHISLDDCIKEFISFYVKEK